MAGTLTLTDVRAIVRSSLHVSVQTYSDSEVDRAVKAAFNELITETSLSRTSGTITLTANDATVDVSTITLFRPERIVRAQIVYNDRSTWLTATAYAVNDLVRGDGSPDSLLYVAHTAHTSSASNEPGGSSTTDNWTRVNWKGGFQVQIKDYDFVASLLDGEPTEMPIVQATIETGPATESARPFCIAFFDSDTAFVYPVPDIAYKLEIIYKQALETWTDGASGGSVTFASIDNEFISQAAWLGPLTYLETSDTQSAHWSRYRDEWRRLLKKWKGYVNYNPGVLHKEPNDYL